MKICEQSFDTECETLEEEECNTIYEEVCEPVYKVRRIFDELVNDERLRIQYKINLCKYHDIE